MTELVLPGFPRSKMFVDVQRQVMSTEWLNFLLALYQRVGGQSADLPFVSGLTALRITATDASNQLGSVADLADWVGGTANQITVTDDGDGTITLSLPQSIAITSSVQFASVLAAAITNSSLTASRIMASDASKALVSVANLASWVAGTTNQITVANDGDGTITLSLPQSIATTSLVTFGGLTVNGQIAHTGILRLIDNTPAQITADQDDYNPGSYAVLRLSSDAPRNITGFVPGATPQGQLLFVFNVGANNIVLQHQNAGSVEANRLLSNTGVDLTISANEIAFLWYDSTTTRWRMTEL